MTRTWLVLLGAIAACATDVAPAPAGPVVAASYGRAASLPADAARYLYVVGGDYATTALSVLDLAGLATGDVASTPPAAAHVLHSGSKVGAVATALSGDVVLAQSSPGQRRALLVDRANAVLTVFDPVTLSVVEQVSVALGFYANPQDALVLGDGRWLVPRMGRNAHPTGILDGGDDVVSIRAGLLEARMGLAAHATVAGHLAAPQRLAQAMGRAWLGLGSFAADFKAVGPGRLLALTADGGAVDQAVDVTMARNCVTVAPLDDGGLVAACQGSFAKGADQVAQSALVAVRRAGSDFAVTPLAKADVATGPWSRDIAVAAGQVFAVSLGDLATGRPDRLWRIAAASGTRMPVASSGQPFGFSGLWFDRARRVLWIGERNAPGGDLRRFALDLHGNASEGKPVRSNPRGLGALDLGGY
ncbi:MAG: hypothetical protein FJ100_02185 [Deltaproteobacteria bacterium]|nr:hypothetical protein [Deltaproteobacteria bacterium]